MTGATQTFDWQKHLGLIVGGSVTTLICLKLLAVSRWNSITAFGILAASGTTNVLTGTLLAALPPVYAALAPMLILDVQQRLKRRPPVERSAALMVLAVPAALLLLLAPLASLLAVLLVFVVVLVAVVVVRRRRRVRPGKTVRESAAGGGEAPSKFELAVVSLSIFVSVGFNSLSTPWLPPETVATSTGTETAYVLENQGSTATVLLAGSRTLAQVPTDAVAGNYCTLVNVWWLRPLPELFTGDRYPRCPED